MVFGEMSEGLDVIGDGSEIWEEVVSGKISSSTSPKSFFKRFQFLKIGEKEIFDSFMREGAPLRSNGCIYLIQRSRLI